MAESLRQVGHAIEVQDLCKCYRTHTVLDRVSLTADHGRTLALIGHNGAGKTSLLKILLGLSRPTTGHVRVLGQNPEHAQAELRRKHGFLPEHVAFHGAMSGREVLRFYARLKRLPRRDVDELLEQVGMSGAADRRINTYSKGMRQRLGLAQALLGNPALLLLDEPTTGLDPFLRRDLYDIVHARRDLGAAVLICTHSLDEIEQRADCIAIMRQGKLIAQGSLDALRQATGLPVRIRVATVPGQARAVAEALGSGVDLQKVNDRSVHLDCLETEKLGFLRRIAEQPERVRDVEIQAPRLEQIYAHYVGEGKPQ